ncbi:MAG TPA: hydroxylamine reductase, partial [Bacillota bacterium]|nr:hydroxylamine reductase [Bacillota bacterium]
MFCHQCEQTAKGVACTAKGVCGKTADLADLQDLLMHAVRGLSHFAMEGRKVGANDPEINRFTVKAIFSTLTNVNFDESRFRELINQTVA